MRELKKLPINSFLDVGCGSGYLDCMLVKGLGLKGEGVDFSKTALSTAELLKKYYRLGEQPIFKLTSSRIPRETKRADVVICLEVLEHIKDDEKMLSELIRLSNRFVVISVPAKQHLFSHSDKLAGHYRRYEKRDLKLMMKKNELKVLSFMAYGYPFTNLLRLAREKVASKTDVEKYSMEVRSKKSGVDLMNLNQRFNLPLEWLLQPFYHASRPFNRMNLSEGYLVIAEKISR